MYWNRFGLSVDPLGRASGVLPAGQRRRGLAWRGTTIEAMPPQTKVEKLEAQLLRFHLSANDFYSARYFLLAWRARQNEIVRDALLQAAVVAYARPFSGNDEHEKATGTPRLRLPRLLDAPQRRLHDQLLELRHKLYAHTTYEATKPRRSHPLSSTVLTFKSEPFAALEGGVDRAAFEVLSLKLAGACIDKCFELADALRKLGVAFDVNPPNPFGDGST